VPAWLAGAPWWVVAGLVIAIVALIFRVGAWKASTDSRLGVLEEAAGEIRADVKEVRAGIEKMFRRFPTLAVERDSPVRLTELGKDISATADTEAWTLKHVSHLMNETSGKPEFEVF